MNDTRQIETFHRNFLLPQLGKGWAARGRRVFVAPVGYVWRGFEIEPIKWHKGEYRLSAFATPLYAPREHEASVFGESLDAGWAVDKADLPGAADHALRLIRGKGLRWLNKVADPAGVAAITHAKKGTENQCEAAVYGLIWAGRNGPELQSKAAPLLKYLEGCREDEDWGKGRSEWWNKMYLRMQTMLDLASSKKTLPKARAQLDTWRMKSIRTLKLTPWK
jgi:hypothetical protein